MFLRRFPGHALHEKGLQRQIGVGTLVSSQERRALAVLVINRLSTAGQPLISVLHRFTYDKGCSCFRRDVQDSVFDSLESKREGCLLAGSTRRRAVLPKPDPLSPPRRAPPQTDWPVVCPGFGIDRFVKTICVGTLASQQQRRTVAVLSINL